MINIILNVLTIPGVYSNVMYIIYNNYYNSNKLVTNLAIIIKINANIILSV